MEIFDGPPWPSWAGGNNSSIQAQAGGTFAGGTQIVAKRSSSPGGKKVKETLRNNEWTGEEKGVKLSSKGKR